MHKILWYKQHIAYPFGLSCLLFLHSAFTAEDFSGIHGNGWNISIPGEELDGLLNKKNPTTFKLIQSILKGQPQSTFLEQVLTASQTENKVFYDYLMRRLGDPASTPHILVINEPSLTPVEMQGKFAHMVIGSLGDDFIEGDERDNWIAGLSGIDAYEAGDGDDVLFVENSNVDAQAGNGIDTVIVSSSQGVTLNLTTSAAEIAFGNTGNDVLIAGGRRTVYINGGAGEDILIGSAANDVLVGDLGDDLVDGGAGNDLIYGGAGRDRLLGGSGDDILLGQDEDDSLSGAEGNDVFEGGAGDDQIDGGHGTDMASFSGDLQEYRLQRMDETGWRISDRINERDGSDTLSNIETLYFKNTSWVDLNSPEPIPVADLVTLRPTEYEMKQPLGKSVNIVVLDASRLTSNDISMDNTRLEIQAIIDRYGKEIPRDQLGNLSSGRIMLTSDHKIVFVPDIIDEFTFSFTYLLKPVNPAKPRTIHNPVNMQTFRMGARAFVQPISTTVALAESEKTLTCTRHCVLDEGLEKLVLAGSDHLHGNGNASDNTLIGNAGNNILDGAEGADHMLGGAGNDTYMVDDEHDLVKEEKDGGMDYVFSAIDTYKLPPHVETLTLLHYARSGIGNDLNNLLIGNAADNILMGEEGDDILEGNGGNDSLNGGKGNDILIATKGQVTLIFNPGDGKDIIQQSATSQNTLVFEHGVPYQDIALSRSGDNLLLSTANLGDEITLPGWFTSKSQLTLQSSDGKRLHHSQISTFFQQVSTSGLNSVAQGQNAREKHDIRSQLNDLWQ